MAYDPLPSWRDAPTRAAVVDFVERVTGPGGLAPEERVAVFDDDGTFWCEKPLPVQADFLFRRLAETAQADLSLRGRRPWKAAVEKDYGWLGGAITKHHRGDDADLDVMAGGLLEGDGKPYVAVAGRAGRRRGRTTPARVRWGRSGAGPGVRRPARAGSGR